MEWSKRVLVSRSLAMPADTNPRGDIFGGWIMSLMDIAVGTVAGRIAKGPVATRAVKEILFNHPIFVGDEVSVYVQIIKIGITSMTFSVNVSIQRSWQYDKEIEAISGKFVMVALDDQRKPKPISCCSINGLNSFAAESEQDLKNKAANEI